MTSKYSFLDAVDLNNPTHINKAYMFSVNPTRREFIPYNTKKAITAAFLRTGGSAIAKANISDWCLVFNNKDRHIDVLSYKVDTYTGGTVLLFSGDIIPRPIDLRNTELGKFSDCDTHIFNYSQYPPESAIGRKYVKKDGVSMCEINFNRDPGDTNSINNATKWANALKQASTIDSSKDEVNAVDIERGLGDKGRELDEKRDELKSLEDKKRAELKSLEDKYNKELDAKRAELKSLEDEYTKRFVDFENALAAMSRK